MGASGAGAVVEDAAPGLVGLHNFHNTCYMNASIQCLAHCPLLVEEFLKRYRASILDDGVNVRNLSSTGLKGGETTSASEMVKAEEPNLADGDASSQVVPVGTSLIKGQLADEFGQLVYLVSGVQFLPPQLCACLDLCRLP